MPPNPATDAAGEPRALIARVARGDRAAFRRLYELFAPKLHGAARRITRDGPLAEEATQEAFVRIWTRAASYDPAMGAPLAWAGAIARHAALDAARRRTDARAGDLMPGLDPDEALARLSGDGGGEAGPDGAERVALGRCLGALAPEHRRLVVLAYADGLSREELAQRFGRPVGTIKTWIHRALGDLRGCLGGAR